MTKVFYIEDELALARIVTDTLRLKGYDVLHLADGDNALETFINYAPDICVFDVMLPVKDGFSISKGIRKKDKSIPILFLTAKSTSEDVVLGFKSGGNDYVRKPFSIEELIVRIENLLSFSRKHDEAVLNEKPKVGRFFFEYKKQILSSGDFSQRLSFKETQLLKMLVDNKAEVVSRKDILNAVWSDDNFFNSRTLDVYITKLRGYFKADPSVEIITLKGVGYRLVDEL